MSLMFIIARIAKMEIFKDFEWYDFVVIAIFAKVMQVLVILTLVGGGLITGTILLVVWELWKAYEKYRAKYEM